LHQNYRIHHNNWVLRTTSPVADSQKIHIHLPLPDELCREVLYIALYLIDELHRRS